MIWARRFAFLLLLLAVGYVVVVLGPLLLAFLVAAKPSRNPLVVVAFAALALRWALRGVRAA